MGPGTMAVRKRLRRESTYILKTRVVTALRVGGGRLWVKECAGSIKRKRGGATRHVRIEGWQGWAQELPGMRYIELEKRSGISPTGHNHPTSQSINQHSIRKQEMSRPTVELELEARSLEEAWSSGHIA
ncbi:hypothetical protein C8J57DRAFT_1238789 [Mycena rebaudengoi]|nr:hypothetical protein C8J57DRAFT_1238789 [Mycena rebaudengoi]